jgi:glucuronoarabinoxylan endo-1,4-beta-xylanase
MNIQRMFKHMVFGLILAAGSLPAPAQTTIFDEDFDGGYVGAFNTGSYMGGSPSFTTNEVMASGGNPNGAWQETMITKTVSDYYGGQVQLEAVTGNTDTNPAHYQVSFDAKGSQAVKFQAVIQTWSAPYFGGTGPVVNISIDPQLTNANTWQTFRYNLGTLTKTNPTGATWQFSYQLNASQWAGADHTDTLTIDNIILKNILVIPALTLTASANPAITGNGVTFTATLQTNGLTVGNATGQVVFYDGAGPFSTNTVNGGSATSSSIADLAVGTDPITAIYSSGNYPNETNALAELVSTLTTGQCTVDWNTVYQRIDGFGASSAFSQNTWTPAEADLFFSTNYGIGLSLLRNEVQPPDTTNDVAFASATEIGLMQMAQDRGARVWSTPWSPPTFCKDIDSLDGGDYMGIGDSYTNQLYASELAGYVANMKNIYGVSLYAISIQNEPDQSTSYASCLWTDQQYHDFATNLYNALVINNVASTKIMLPEQSSWQSAYYLTAMNDTNVAADVGIIADHNYDGPNFDTGATAPPAALPNYGKPLWETEVSTGDAYDGSISNAMYWATRIHLFMTVAQANAWHYWWLIDEGADNQGLTDGSGNPAKRMFALGNFSRFVRPGFYRIDANGLTSAMVSAYDETNSGAFVIVAINTNATISISQTFMLTNFTHTGSSVTPWITSISQNSTNSLPQVPISGSSFTYTLPAMSVVTFVGSAAANSMPRLSIMSTGANNTLVLSWPGSGGITLQTNNNLKTSNWVDYSGPITITNGTNSISITTTTGNLFFRLFSP